MGERGLTRLLAALLAMLCAMVGSGWGKVVMMRRGCGEGSSLNEATSGKSKEGGENIRGVNDEECLLVNISQEIKV